MYQHLLDMLANCGKSKEPKPPPECDRSNIPEGYWMDSSCKLHRSTKFWGHIDLGAIASNVPRVEVTLGGSQRGPESDFRGAPPKKKPKNVDALTWAYQLATWACQEKQVRANQSYYRCLATEGQTRASCKSLYVSVSCPDVKRLQDLIRARNSNKPSGPGFNGGGGQFGGGGASGSF